jgi:hypothetical protein
MAVHTMTEREYVTVRDVSGHGLRCDGCGKSAIVEVGPLDSIKDETEEGVLAMCESCAVTAYLLIGRAVRIEP